MKKALSVILAVIFAFSAIGALAVSADDAQTITVYDCEYTIGGTLENGMTVAADSEEETYTCYPFTAPETGFYKITAVYNTDDVFADTEFSAEVEDGEVTDTKVLIYDRSASLGSDVLYVNFEKNEESYMLSGTRGTGEIKFFVEYVGVVESITCASPLIRNFDITYFEDGGLCMIDCLYNIAFENGSTCTAGDMLLDESGRDINEDDSYMAVIDFLGEEYTVEYPIVSVGDYIDSIDFSDGFTPSYKTYYNVEGSESEIPDGITVNFADGTSAGCELNGEITIPGIDGRTFSACVIYEDGFCTVTIGDYSEIYEAKEVKQSFFGALRTMFSDIKGIISYHFSLLTQGQTLGKTLPGIMISLVRSVNGEISNFIAYYK